MKPELAFNAMMSRDLVTVVPESTRYKIYEINKDSVATVIEIDGSGAVRKVPCEWLKFVMVAKQTGNSLKQR